jgi:hypothetical protein
MSEYKQTEQANPMKYLCLDKLPEVVDNTKDQWLKDYLKELYDLIQYQIREIHQQRQEIVSIKHKYAWRKYDK